MNFWVFVGSYLEAVILRMQSEKRLYVEHWDFFQILLVGMGFEHWEVGFRKKNGLGNGTGTPPSGPSLDHVIA